MEHLGRVLSFISTERMPLLLDSCVQVPKEWTTGSRQTFPDSKVHGANLGLTWVLSAPDGPHVGPMSLAIRVALTPQSTAVPAEMIMPRWAMISLHKEQMIRKSLQCHDFTMTFDYIDGSTHVFVAILMVVLMRLWLYWWRYSCSCGYIDGNSHALVVILIVLMYLWLYWW